MKRFNSWIRTPHPAPQAKLRLFCLPHAGGGAGAYHGWGKALPTGVEVCPVQLPGREDRFNEPPHTRLDNLVEALAVAIKPHLDRPFALFGHSMGALISYRLTLELWQQTGLKPLHLFVSGRPAPHIPLRRPVIHGLPDAHFLTELQHRYGGLPDEFLKQSELLELFLPLLRADFSVVETYTHTERQPLPCPLTAFGGLADATVSRADLEAWGGHTGTGFSVECFEGGHFYLQQSQQALLSSIGRRLAYF